MTTPNAEYNAVFESMSPGAFRHDDHRFEWTRSQFETWANGVAEAHGYSVSFSGIGDADEAGRGTPTQTGVFDLVGGK